MTAIHADALALAARGAKDSVSNVRYVAAKVLAAASSVVAPALIESDVKYAGCVVTACAAFPVLTWLCCQADAQRTCRR